MFLFRQMVFSIFTPSGLGPSNVYTSIPKHLLEFGISKIQRTCNNELYIIFCFAITFVLWYCVRYQLTTYASDVLVGVRLICFFYVWGLLPKARIVCVLNLNTWYSPSSKIIRKALPRLAARRLQNKPKPQRPHSRSSSTQAKA